MMSASGKALIEDEADPSMAANTALVEGAAGRNAQPAPRSQSQHSSRQLWRPAFNPAFTLLGTQPQILLPQATGDVLLITTRIGGPTLPGFGPSPYMQQAAAAAQRYRRLRLTQEAVDGLLPAAVPSRDIKSQVAGGHL